MNVSSRFVGGAVVAASLVLALGAVGGCQSSNPDRDQSSPTAAPQNGPGTGGSGSGTNAGGPGNTTPDPNNPAKP